MCKAGVHRTAANMPPTSGLPVLEGSQQTTQVRATTACHRIGGLSVLKAASSPTVHFNQARASGKLCVHHKGSANECQWHIGTQHACRGLRALCFAHQPNCPVKGTPIRLRALRSPSGRPLPLALGLWRDHHARHHRHKLSRSAAPLHHMGAQKEACTSFARTTSQWLAAERNTSLAWLGSNFYVRVGPGHFSLDQHPNGTFLGALGLVLQIYAQRAWPKRPSYRSNGNRCCACHCCHRLARPTSEAGCSMSQSISISCEGLTGRCTRTSMLRMAAAELGR